MRIDEGMTNPEAKRPPSYRSIDLHPAVGALLSLIASCYLAYIDWKNLPGVRSLELPNHNAQEMTENDREARDFNF